MNTASVKSKTSSQYRTRKMVVTAMFSALASALMFFEFPLPFLAPPEIYKLDFSEVPVLIGGFALGPISGITIELIKILLKFVIKGTMTFGVGELANFAIGCAIVVPASLIYKFHRTRTGALIGMGAGTLIMSIFGAFINGFVLIPVYASAFHMEISAIVEMGKLVNQAIDSVFKFCLIAVTPFNILKGIIISAITFIIYKPLSGLIHKFVQ